MVRPPHFATVILRAFSRSETTRDMAADLAEEFPMQVSERGVRRAQLWYCRQVFFSLMARLLALFSGDRLAADLRYARRALLTRTSASFTLLLVTSIGLATFTTLFALADPYVLRPLPYDRPDSLISIEIARRGLTPDHVVPSLDDWRGRTDLFESVAASRSGTTHKLRSAEGVVAFRTTQVTPNFFDVLGIPAQISSGWHPSHTGGGTHPTLLSREGRATLDSRGLTQLTTFDTNNGAQIVLSGQVTTPLPYLPGDGFTPFDAGPIVNIRWTAPDKSAYSVSGGLAVLARMRSGVTASDVAAALATTTTIPLRIDTLNDLLLGDVRPLALGALLSGLFLLLICTGNIANLVLTRSAFREHEFATRLALGASRFDLLRLWIVEIAVVVALSLSAGLLLTWFALAGLAQVIPSAYTTFGVPDLTLRVAAAGIAGCLLLFVLGFLPAALISAHMSYAVAGARASRRAQRLRFVRPLFGATQAALAMVLAIGAGMLVQSYAHLMNQDVGFDPDAHTAMVTAPRPGPIDLTLEAISHIPGVEHVAASAGMNTILHADGPPTMLLLRHVTPGYFDAMGMRFIEGHGTIGTHGVVVSASVAQLRWPGTSPLGELFSYGSRSAPITVPVVGVVQDIFTNGLDQPPTPSAFVSRPEDTPAPLIEYVFRGSSSLPDQGRQIRRTIMDLNPSAEVSSVSSLRSTLTGTIKHRTFATLLLSIIGLAGGLVALIGLAGIVHFMVRQRTHEIAIRLAIGADRRHIRRLVVREGFIAALTGSVLGLILGRWLSTGLSSLVFGLQAGNWTTSLAVGAGMLVIMTMATLLPARRALRLEPVQALRIE